MRTQSGSITMSSQLFEETRKTEAAWSRLEWIALHYDEASDEDRAHLDAHLAAIDRMEEW